MEEYQVQKKNLLVLSPYKNSTKLIKFKSNNKAVKKLNF